MFQVSMNPLRPRSSSVSELGPAILPRRRHRPQAAASSHVAGYSSVEPYLKDKARLLPAVPVVRPTTPPSSSIDRSLTVNEAASISQHFGCSIESDSESSTTTAVNSRCSSPISMRTRAESMSSVATHFTTTKTTSDSERTQISSQAEVAICIDDKRARVLKTFSLSAGHSEGDTRKTTTTIGSVGDAQHPRPRRHTDPLTHPSPTRSPSLAISTSSSSSTSSLTPSLISASSYSDLSLSPSLTDKPLPTLPPARPRIIVSFSPDDEDTIARRGGFIASSITDLSSLKSRAIDWSKPFDYYTEANDFGRNVKVEEGEEEMEYLNMYGMFRGDAPDYRVEGYAQAQMMTKMGAVSVERRQSASRSIFGGTSIR